MSADVVMALYEIVAGSSEPLSPLAQSMIAVAATAEKSSAGDRVLGRLGLREDLTGKAYQLVESSSRAAVKAVWLSRPDLTSGYVEQAVASEKRVTVLTTVAAHPDASRELLMALAARNHLAVAVQLLYRADLPDDVALAALQTMIGKAENLTWHQTTLLRSALSVYSNIRADLIRSVTDTLAMRALLAAQLSFPESVLAHAFEVACRGWQASIVRPSGKYTSEPYRVLEAAERLLEMETWLAGSEEDLAMAEMINGFSAATRPRSCEWWPPPDQVVDCFDRNFGSPQARSEALAKRARRAAELHEARTTTDPLVWSRIVSSGSDALIAALVRNEHVRLADLQDADSLELIVACVDRGDDPLRAAGILAVESSGRHGGLYPYDDDQAATVARHAVEYVRAGHSGQVPHWRGVTLLRNPQLARHVVLELSSVEIVGYVRLMSDDSSVDRVVIGDALCQLLSTELATEEQWTMFTALASEMESSLRESVAVAGSI